MEGPADRPTGSTGCRRRRSRKESTFREIRLGFDAKGLAALELLDAFGQRSVVRFSGFERNPKLAASLFAFTPPKGADVIGDK